MYIEIQRMINKVMIIIFMITLLILVTGYYFSSLYHWNKVYLFVLFFVVLIMNYTVIRFLEKNLEYHQIYKMLNRGDIALCQIKNAKFYKESRDSRFQKQFIYELDVKIITQDNQVIKTKIFESLLDTHFNCLPGYVYVTFDSHQRMIGIIPTFLLNMTPSISPIVKKYEDQYEIKYIAAMRKQGLVLKSMQEVMSMYQNTTNQ